MKLVLYNTRLHEKAQFTPMKENVGVYLCGPTVYDFAHIGNARNAIVFDILVRLLRRIYPKVTYVRNITDIDDKINAKAIECGVDISVITAATTIQYHQDMASLFVLPPDVEPRATAHIPEIIMIVEKLIENGHAYVSENHVLFSVSSYSKAGLLSGNHNEDRVPSENDSGSYKRDDADFVLWKPSTPELPGWDSPWGRGRPGWHIECSAMSWKHLGTDFDIHGGGVDLIFPHHENEISQSCCAFPGSHYANVWVHNQMMLVDGKKMSKSLGNFKTIRDVLSIVPGEAVRFFILKTHYRSTLDFTVEGLEEAKRDLDKFYRVLEMYPDVYSKNDEFSSIIESPLMDDLNTPEMIATIHFYANLAKTGMGILAPQNMFEAGKSLGIFNHTPEEWFRGAIENDILKMIEDRNQARAAKNFARSDEIRNSLKERGIILEDSPSGTTWRKI